MNFLVIIPPILNGLFTAFMATLISLAAWQELISGQTEFALITLLLIFYLAVEISRVRTMQPNRWLANPIVLCSLFTFILPFCLNNLLVILPVDWGLLREILPPVTPSVNKLMLLVLCGAIAMWLGYWAMASDSLAQKLKNSIFLSRVLRNEISPRTDILFIFVAISLLSTFVSINLGIFGFSSDPDQLERLSSVSQYFFLAQGLSRLVLVVVALHYFSFEKKERQTTLWFFGLLAYEVAIGVFSGFKSQVVIPFLIIGICQYLNTSRIPWRIIALVPLAFFAAYVIIEPFRSTRIESSSFDSRSATSIINTVMQSMSASDSDISIKSDNAKLLVGLAVLSRISLTEVGAAGIEYADRGFDRTGAPAFLGPLLLSPLYAIVPRFLWESKQDSSYGSWYYHEVIGGPDFINTASAMGPVTFLYIAGGWIAVFIGFLILGGIHRIIYVAFLMNNQKGALIVFLVALSQVLQIEIFYGMLINLIRLVPIALLLQYVVLRPTQLGVSVSHHIDNRMCSIRPDF